MLEDDRRNEESSRLNCKPEKSGDFNSCNYTSRLYTSTQWLKTAGETAKQRFLTGVLVRCQSVETLENVQNVLQVTLGKDFTYTRSRNRVKARDMVTNCNWSSAPDAKLLGKEVLNTWEWFKTIPNSTKTSFILGLLTSCDSELLYMLGNLVRVLIAREKSNLNFRLCNTGKRIIILQILYLLAILLILNILITT